MNDLYSVQLELERNAITMAKAKRSLAIDNAKDKGEVHGTSHVVLREIPEQFRDTLKFSDITNAVNAAIYKVLNEQIGSTDVDKIAARTVIFPVMDALDNETMALLAIEELYRASLITEWDDRPTVPGMAIAIGTALLNAWRFEKMQNTGLGKAILKRMEERRPVWESKSHGFKVSFNRIEKNVQRLLLDELIEWDESVRAVVGLAVISCVVNHTRVTLNGEEMPIFHWEDVCRKSEFKGGEPSRRVVITMPEPVRAAIEDSEQNWIDLSRQFPIMVVPPNPMTGAGREWTPYLTIPVTMIKESFLGAHDSGEEANLHRVSDVTRRSVDAIANTAWRVNTEVLDVAQHYFSKRSGEAGCPVLPEDPTDRQLGQYRGKQAAYKAILSKAQEYREFNDLYFPHNLDFRTRVYALPTSLTPQGQDLSKGCLMFSHRKALGERGWWWLRVHVANCFGQDKGSLDSRVQWVMDNHAMLMSIADDPYATDAWWTGDADETQWTALAAALDYAAAINSGDPLTYESAIPVQVDGKCNGLQHLAASTKCEQSGPLVALDVNPTGLDIYETNAEYLREGCAEEAEQWEFFTRGKADRSELRDLPCEDGDGGRKYAVHAAWWCDKIDRKVAKLPTMTKPYGVSNFGMADQVKGILTDKGYLTGDKDDMAGPRANYFVDLANATLTRMMPGPASAMDWLQELASKLSSTEQGMRWTTPAGDVVMMRYPHTSRRTKDAFDMYMKLRVPKATKTGKEVKTSKQRNGACANFIHSRDASHMHLTIGRCADSGIRSFSMIHDSFGTHAADVDVMVNHLRAVFVDIYSGDVFAELADQISEYTTMPEMTTELVTGTLDIQRVLESELFFC